ncbi:MAG: cysteine hydrolase family protein [Gammaproteobacteria bacterium]
MHTIDIPQKYLDWVVHRRGRRHIFERIDLDKTALLVIDMQNGFLIPGYSPLEVPGLQSIVPNINRLVHICREHGVRVVWTQQTYSEEWRSWARNFATPQMRDRIIAETAEDAHGFQIHDSLDVAAGDLRITKRRSSAFTPGSCNLHQRLQASGHDTLIITGTLSNVCCEATARDAMLLNYNTLFVADANGARSDEEHNATLVNMIQFFADVLMTQELERLIVNSAATGR